MDTNTHSESSPYPRKLQRLGSNSSVISNDISESRKLTSSKYKGVVPQPNGRWGSQIYEKHHRVWLGTFVSESEAALSYDIAAYRFRGRDAITNFTTIKDESEFDFVSSRSKAEIVDMLRKHTYRDELNQSKRFALSCTGQLKRKRNDSNGGIEQMFEKMVTPSDVGKLNRLVIPKLYAEKHFPSMVNNKSMLLSFKDEEGKVWRFRYSYWNSSQSYVLTKGWSRFVKEKGLKVGGVVVFGKLVGEEEQFYVECRPSADDRNESYGEDEAAAVAIKSDVFRLFGVNYLLDVSRKEIICPSIVFT